MRSTQQRSTIHRELLAVLKHVKMQIQLIGHGIASLPLHSFPQISRSSNAGTSARTIYRSRPNLVAIGAASLQLHQKAMDLLRCMLGVRP